MRKPTVRSGMTTGMITTTPRTPPPHAAGPVVEYGVSALPVANASGVLVGVVSAADLLAAEAGGRAPGSMLGGWLRRHARRRARTADGAMTPEPETVDNDERAENPR